MNIENNEGKWSCPHCKEKDRRIRELEEQLELLTEIIEDTEEELCDG